MPITINWTVNVQVPGGPKYAMAGSQDVEAYNVIDVPVAAGASLPVSVKPTKGELTFLLVQATAYHDTDLHYTVNGDTSNSYNLQAPHILIGTGATMMLDSAIETLEFTNDNTTSPVSIKILAGRDATP